MRVTAHLASSLAIVAFSACRGDASPAVARDVEPQGATAIASPPPDSATLAAAQHVLRVFLDASRESTPDAVTLDTLGACGDVGTSFFPSTVLAAYSLLPFEFRGDTIVGRAEVVTVAEQDIDRRVANRFVARQRVRSDVLEWDVVPEASGRWTVCNGLRFGYRGADSLTIWRPDGATYQSARRLADSIAAVRR